MIILTLYKCTVSRAPKYKNKQCTVCQVSCDLKFEIKITLLFMLWVGPFIKRHKAKDSRQSQKEKRKKMPWMP